MRERAEPILRFICLILAALVLYELAGFFLRINPLHGVIVPALPSLTTNSNSLPETEHQPGSTSAMVVKTTNSAPIFAGTNRIALEQVPKTGTNLASRLATKAGGTNVIASPKSAERGTNLLAAATGTNDVSRSDLEMKAANPSAAPKKRKSHLNPFQPPGKRDDLPPAIQAQISQITDSEILGPVIHPLPMALMGIAGDVAFLRSPDGQTGLVQTGDSLGEIKLLRIGINRVLVEQDGQQQELTIFSGYGGESLLLKPEGTNDEIHNP
jgi:hypothetical protein